jgi:hypothetical protein
MLLKDFVVARMDKNTKICFKCKEEKPLSDFFKRSNSDTPRSYCKRCWIKYNKKYDDNYKFIHHDKIRFRESDSRKKEYLCAKVFCPAISSVKVVELICNVCGRKYGYPLSKYKNKIKGPDHHHPKYCSRECQHESLKKSWNKKSPYAKKVKGLRKTYGV